MEEKIKEIVATGKLKYLDELKKDIPEGLIEMLNVPGIGPRTAKVLYEKLDIQDIVMLERMAAAGKIRDLPGMGEKTEENWRDAWETVQRGHAISNSVHVAAVNRVGKEGNLKSPPVAHGARPVGRGAYAPARAPTMRTARVQLLS